MTDHTPLEQSLAFAEKNGFHGARERIAELEAERDAARRDAKEVRAKVDKFKVEAGPLLNQIADDIIGMLPPQHRHSPEILAAVKPIRDLLHLPPSAAKTETHQPKEESDA